MNQNINFFLRKRNWRYLTDLVFQKAWAGLRAEAARGYLGVMWWVLEPVMYMTVFYIVFVHLFRRGNENFIVFLLTGLIAWKWFNTTISTGSNSILNSSGLMNQVYLPKIIFPLTTIAINTFKFLIVLAIFLVFLQFTPMKPSLAWIFLPILIILQLVLITGITSLLAAIMPFFPDFRFIIDNILMMMLFLSGIFFDVTKLPADVRVYFFLNPMAALIAMYRKILINGTLPNLYHILYVMSLSFIVLFLALWLLRRFDRVYPKIIH
jgi:lipopolysaccharide transport system permease protein